VKPETPFIARVLQELEVDLADVVAGAAPTSPTIHSLFFVLQEVCNFPVRFAFKGALVPYSDGLESVLRERAADPEFWGNDRAPRVELGQDELDAFATLRRLTAAPPADTTKSRWIELLAAYIFVARSPLYMNGRHAVAESDFAEFFARTFRPEDVKAAAETVRSVLAQAA
jgi:hypothetical protein